MSSVFTAQNEISDEKKMNLVERYLVLAGEESTALDATSDTDRRLERARELFYEATLARKVPGVEFDVERNDNLWIEDPAAHEAYENWVGWGTPQGHSDWLHPQELENEIMQEVQSQAESGLLDYETAQALQKTYNAIDDETMQEIEEDHQSDQLMQGLNTRIGDPPVRDAKVRKSDTSGSPAFSEEREVRGSLPDGVSMSQSGYGGRYGGRR